MTAHSALRKEIEALNRATCDSLLTSGESSQRALQLANQINDPALIAQSHVALSSCYARQFAPAKGLEHARAALEIYDTIPEEEHDRWWTCLLRCSLGMLYDDLGEFPEALWNHKQSLAIAELADDLFGQQRALFNIAYIYFQMGHGDLAIETISTILQQPHHFPRLLAGTYETLADAYASRSRWGISQREL